MSPLVGVSSRFIQRRSVDFPGAGHTDDARYITFVNIEIDVAQNFVIAEGF